MIVEKQVFLTNFYCGFALSLRCWDWAFIVVHVCVYVCVCLSVCVLLPTF